MGKKKDKKRKLREQTAVTPSSHHESSWQLSEFAYAKTLVDNNPCAQDPYSKENFERMKSYLENRVKASRFEHSLSVAKTARKLAEVYGVDPDKARMAGLLHDWDKALSPERLRNRVRDYHLSLDAEAVAYMPWLLHGPTAAAVLGDQFPELGTDVFQAIERHTVATPDMAPLDLIIFCADKLEPTNGVETYQKIAKKVGRISLEDLFFLIQKEGIRYLIDSDRPLNQGSVEVWNWYINHRNNA